jgi:hypothetical protein
MTRGTETRTQECIEHLDATLGRLFFLSANTHPTEGSRRELLDNGSHVEPSTELLLTEALGAEPVILGLP